MTVVPKTVTSLSVAVSNTHLTVVGSPASLTVTAHFNDGSTQNVTSAAVVRLSNSDVRVSGNQIYGMHGGQDTIQVTYQGQTATVSVNVTAVLQSVSISPSTVSVAASKTQALSAIAHYNDGTTQNLMSAATSTSSNNYLATVRAGVVTAYHHGEVKVTATYGGKTGTSSVNVTTTVKSMQLLLSRSWVAVSGLPSVAELKVTYTDGTCAYVTTGFSVRSYMETVAFSRTRYMVLVSERIR